MEIIVVPDLGALAKESSVRMVGPRIAVSGGSTFAALFPLWQNAVASRLSRSEVLRFYPVDERMVGYEDAGCNWKVCVESLLDPVGLEEQRDHHVTSVPGFRHLLENGLQPDGRFDSVFLGMGTDGHTASLFPGSEALRDTQSAVVETWSPKPPYPRLSLALRMLWSAHNLVAIVTGKDKAGMVRRLRDGDESLPITLALKGHPRPVLLLDEAAAG